MKNVILYLYLSIVSFVISNLLVAIVLVLETMIPQRVGGMVFVTEAIITVYLILFSFYHSFIYTETAWLRNNLVSVLAKVCCKTYYLAFFTTLF